MVTVPTRTPAAPVTPPGNPVPTRPAAPVSPPTQPFPNPGGAGMKIPVPTAAQIYPKVGSVEMKVSPAGPSFPAAGSAEMKLPAPGPSFPTPGSNEMKVSPPGPAFPLPGSAEMRIPPPGPSFPVPGSPEMIIPPPPPSFPVPGDPEMRLPAVGPRFPVPGDPEMFIPPTGPSFPRPGDPEMVIPPPGPRVPRSVPPMPVPTQFFPHVAPVNAALLLQLGESYPSPDDREMFEPAVGPKVPSRPPKPSEKHSRVPSRVAQGPIIPLWRRRLRMASFKGVPFYVEQQGRSSGRRTVLHQYPKRDPPYAEDMGREALHYAITGYLIQAPTWNKSEFYPNPDGNMPTDYSEARDQLEAVLMSPSPGPLLDPYNPYLGAIGYGGQGPLLFMCEKYTITESREKGGFCAIEMSFVEAGIPGFSGSIGASSISTAATVANTANAVNSNAATLLNQQQAIANSPTWSQPLWWTPGMPVPPPGPPGWPTPPQ